MAFGDLYEKYIARGYPERGQSGSALTGTMTAALAADGVIWTLRYPDATTMPSASKMTGKRLYVQRIHFQYTTLTAFTTPVTAGRSLKLVRASGAAGTANPSGGNAYTMVRKRSDVTGETLGVGRVASTGALTTTGFTLETDPIQRVALAGYGASGATYDEVWRFDGLESDPIILLPGQMVAIAANATFDAAGTFELQVDVDAVELG